ncbi:HHL118Wp [Eremothecium sinecaudum]|uniref:HHL118Wp n=1 Tax=Eremothecium sinecaudum TaxID=45286 RepID=A0A109V0E8_9SACH|nr:HHL118Wp [Eremothecium sinecaudum]AMD22652.1 HHL118Wp [Eremothecium sinecaudum]
MTTTKSIQSSARNPSSWDPQDDVLLRHLKEVKKLGWKEIAQYFQNRTPNACQFRWRRLKSGNLKTGHVAAVGPVTGAVPRGSGSRSNSGSSAAIGGIGESSGGNTSSSDSGRSISVNEATGSRRSGSAAAVTDEPGGDHKESGSLAGAPQTMLFGSVAAGATGKFAKPRSYSFNSTSTSVGHRNGANGADENGGLRAQDEENIGLIPKILIRSRRGSVVQQSQQQQQPLYVGSSPSAVATASANLATSLGTTLVNSKARKDSFSSRSRRSSIQTEHRRLSVSQVVNITPSRRPSVITAPISIGNMFNSERRDSFTLGKETSTSSSRRGSVILPARSLSPSFADLPRHMRSHHQQKLQHPQSVLAPNSSTLQKPWLPEEDELLQARYERKLSLDELSILLPHRSDKEIQWRIDSISPLVSSTVNRSTPASPFRGERERSFNDDTAIEEDEDDRNDEFKDYTPVDHENNASSKSCHSGAQKQTSPIFFTKSKENSPTTSDGTARSNTTIPTQNGDPNSKVMNFGSHATSNKGTIPNIEYPMPPNNEFHSMMIHHSHHHHPQPAAIPLPSLNSIFKNVL